MTAGPRSLSTGIALVAVAIAATGVGAAAVALRVARNVVLPPIRRRYDIEVIRFDDDKGIIVLSRTPDTVVPGRYSLWFDDDRGHARIGEIIEHDDHSVTRRVDSVQRGDLARASRARWAGWWYLTPTDLAVPFTDIGIRTPVGVAPAWRIDSAEPNGDWVIQVHGRAVTRAEGLRAVEVFRTAGFTSLLISYRNDGDAPASPDARYALGDDEWQDVEAAISCALNEGANRIILMGWSMGGATVLQCVTRSSLAHHVTAVVLESPVVDWVRVLRFQAAASGLPALVRDAAMMVLASRRASTWVGLDEPIDFDRPTSSPGPRSFECRCSRCTASMMGSCRATALSRSLWPDPTWCDLSTSQSLGIRNSGTTMPPAGSGRSAGGSPMSLRANRSADARASARTTSARTACPRRQGPSSAERDRECRSSSPSAAAGRAPRCVALR